MALRADSEHGGHGRGRNPCISDLAITALAVIWLQKQPKQPEETEGNLLVMLPALTGGARTGPHGLRLGAAGLQQSLPSVVMPTR